MIILKTEDKEMQFESYEELLKSLRESYKNTYEEKSIVVTLIKGYSSRTIGLKGNLYKAQKSINQFLEEK